MSSSPWLITCHLLQNLPISLYIQSWFSPPYDYLKYISWDLKFRPISVFLFSLTGPLIPCSSLPTCTYITLHIFCFVSHPHLFSLALLRKCIQYVPLCMIHGWKQHCSCSLCEFMRMSSPGAWFQRKEWALSWVLEFCVKSKVLWTNLQFMLTQCFSCHYWELTPTSIVSPYKKKKKAWFRDNSMFPNACWILLSGWPASSSNHLIWRHDSLLPTHSKLLFLPVSYLRV